MDELIKAIYELTESLETALTAENEQEFEALLTERDAMMIKVDEYRSLHPLDKYSEEAKRLLDAALQIDMRMAPVLTEMLNETKSSLNKIKRNKAVSKKFHPYSNQTNGVFIDSKK